MATVDQCSTISEAGDAKNSILDQNHQTVTKTKQDRGQSAIPRHLVPVHDQQQEFKAFTSFPNRGSDGLTLRNKPEGTSTSAWSSDDFTYPGIPFQVAHYMCESSPDLLHQVEAALHGTHLYEKKAAKAVPSQQTSALFHMCSTTDALALQESVIGASHRTPAAPDVVAQVVANTYHQNLVESTSHRPSSKPPVGTAQNPEQGNALPGPANEPRKELHPFPRDRITTVVEKRSWLSGGLQQTSMPSTEHDKYVQPTLDGASKSSLPESTEDIGTMSKYADTPVNVRDSMSIASDMEFASSECFELESNFSERLELQSNMSEVSGVDEEMARIRKYLLEASPQVYSPDQFRNHQEVTSNNLELLRAKASLEGQVEALLLEADHAKREREQLHTQLSSAAASSSAQAALVAKLRKEAEVSRFKLDQLESKLKESEAMTARVSCTLDSKAEEALQYREEANISEREAHQARLDLTELKVEVESKDGAIRGLKNKIADLHVELQTVLAAKANLHGELESGKGQVASEKKMKDWYKQQLQESQAAKSRMQQEVIALQNTKADCDSAAEKLRFERDQAKKQLAELQEKAVREKEGLLRHLQNIESDMQEREASFHQLHTDKDIAERLRKVEEDRARITEEKISRHDLEHQLRNSQVEAEAKAEMVTKLEKEVSQLMKQATMLQKTLNDSELERHALREAQVDQECRIKELIVSLQTKDEQLDSVKKGAVALEIELGAVRQEKLEMDDTLTEVKENIVKLDGRLRQMKEELTAKVIAVNQLKQEKSALAADAKMKDVTTEGYRQLALRFEDQLKRAQKQCEEDHMSRCELDNKQIKLANGFLAASEVTNAGSKDSVKKKVDQETTHGHESDVPSYADAKDGEASMDENVTVPRSQDQITQRPLSMDIGTQTDPIGGQEDGTDGMEEQAQKVDVGIAEKDREHKERCRRYESNINVLTKKLRASLKSSKKFEAEIKALEGKLAEVTANSTAPETPGAQRCPLQNGGKSRDAKLYYFRKRIALLENKMTEMQRFTDEESHRADANQQMLVELEKERSRLHTIVESSMMQKENMDELRLPLSDGRCLTDNQSQNLESWKEHIEKELRESLADAKQKLSVEQEKALDLRKQVFKEKLDSSRLGKQVAGLKTETEELKRLLEAKTAEITEAMRYLQEQQQLAGKLRGELSELHVKLSKSNNQVTCLNKELEEGRAKDPVLADQIKTLGWHLQQKNQEVFILQDQHKQLEERYRAEAKQLMQALQNTKKELESVKTELQETLKEKIEFQTKGSEMRAALKLSVERNKALQAEHKRYLSAMDSATNSGNDFSDFHLPESPAPYDESLIASLLQQSISLPESRPLNNLHLCLNTLKQEMAILHQQILEQTDPKS